MDEAEESRLLRSRRFGDEPVAIMLAETARPLRVAIFMRSALVGDLLAAALTEAGLDARLRTPAPVDVDAARSVRSDVALAIADGDEQRHFSRLLAAARGPQSRTPVVAVGPDDRDHMVTAMRGGAAEYVTWNTTMQDLRTKLRDVAAGRLSASRMLQRLGVAVAPGKCEAPRRRALDRLTPRELDVLVLITRGVATDDIAMALGVATPTVRSHVHGILLKLGVHSRLQAAAVAAGRGVA